MSAVVNARDVLLQAASPRLAGVSLTTNVTVNTVNLADSAVTTVKVNDGAVTTAKVADNAVTTAKIVDAAISTVKFATGIEPVSIVSSLPSATGYTGPKAVFNTTDKKLYRYDSATPAWTAAVPAVDVTGQITTTQITDNSVTTGKVAANAITATQIATDAVTANKIQAGAVVAGKIAANAIVADDGVIGNAAIKTAQIADANITTAKITDLNVSTLKIADNAATVPVSAFTLASVTVPASPTTANAISAAITVPTGTPIVIMATCNGVLNGETTTGLNFSIVYELVRDGVTVLSTAFTHDFSKLLAHSGGVMTIPMALAYIATAADASSHTYALRVKYTGSVSAGATVYVTNSSITLMGAKK